MAELHETTKLLKEATNDELLALITMASYELALRKKIISPETIKNIRI